LFQFSKPKKLSPYIQRM